VLILISDLHLADGRVAPNVNPAAFQLFGSEVAGHRQEARSQGDSMDIWPGIRRKIYL
jgi:hypothetical protein